MRISTSKPEAIVLSRKPMDGLLWVGNVPLTRDWGEDGVWVAALWRKEGRAGRQSSRSTGQSSFTPSPKVLKEGSWPTEQGHGHKRPKQVSFSYRVRSSAIREDLEVEPLLLCVEKRQSRWFWHLDVLRFSRHGHLRKDPGEDPGQGGEIISPPWPGNAWWSASVSW